MDLHDRFTDRARNVLRLADQEAHRFRHPAIDTEHILLGLVVDGAGVAVNVLRNVGIDPAKIAMEVESLVDRGTSSLHSGQLLRASSAERVIEYAMDEARNLNHDYVGTEHILLGMLREKGGVAAHVLTHLGLTLEAARKETLRLLSQPAVSGNSKDSPNPSGMLVSEADREFFVRIYRSAVDYCKPRIEKKSGVLLGHVDVWDYAQLFQDVMRELRRQSSPWLVGIFKSLAVRRRLQRGSQNMAKSYADGVIRCAAVYFRNAIYVSFGSYATHEHWIAQAVVHELSHALWERLAGEPLHVNWLSGRLAVEDSKKFNVLVEGFATYAERIWFRDIYPIGVREALFQTMDPASVYFKGMRKVEKLVKDHGSEILMEIPKRWRELAGTV